MNWPKLFQRLDRGRRLSRTGVLRAGAGGIVLPPIFGLAAQNYAIRSRWQGRLPNEVAGRPQRSARNRPAWRNIRRDANSTSDQWAGERDRPIALRRGAIHRRGLYVDTLFPDEHRFRKDETGIYQLPGEFFAGEVVPNRVNGKLYVAVGKYTPLLFEIEGWSSRDNPVRAIAQLPKTVTINAAQIASPSDAAIVLRGGAGGAKFARFAPGLGEPAFDGSMTGWESAEPIRLQGDKDQQVEVRCLYQPDQWLLRWHVRLGRAFTAKRLPSPERIFTHDQLADTLSFYIQSDFSAKPPRDTNGRGGDCAIRVWDLRG